jgi:Fe-S-cluster-containing dehydrogenase component/formate-dependent nitrite reductase membrane component NrfD
VTRYAFLIDHDSCIGCHACTVACKSEHDVPIGVNRTWVKYIEKGDFPDARRFYSVLRCNHCADAPCVTICPTRALFHRADGIVDFDDSRCIGCKSCMNACPYDAIYINPDTHTAHKCNFCAHRVELSLEPSCVIVCPTQAIVAGDLDDPASRISTLLGRHDTKVRAPEQGTRPHVFYKGADEAALDPLRTRLADDGMIWAETNAHHPTAPVELPGHGAQAVARTALTTMHPMAWTAKVSGYLATKAVAGGALMVAALAALVGHADERGFVGVFAPVVALTFAAITGALLVADLKQPGRFLYIFTKPQWRSWLVRGAFILLAFGGAGSLWFLGGVADSAAFVRALAVPTGVLGAGVAGYTAWLFGQCEGRDLWQTPLLLPVLLAQAVTAGAAALTLGAGAFDVADDLRDLVLWCLFGGALGQLALVAVEVTSHGTVHVEMATRAMTHGPYRTRFWSGVAGGMVAPAVLAAASIAADGLVPAALGAVLALGGLYATEDAFVRAGQSVPLS